MITLRKANDRGSIKLDWLNARHSFSFGSYFDPKWMGFKSLRVINEDIIDEGKGFDTHPHKDMEILTFVLDGSLEHRDTLGNHSVIKPGEIQIMSAGTGIQHSEFNPCDKSKTHMLQIWIEPEVKGVEPRYDQFKYDENLNQLTEIANSKGGEKVAKVYQDITVSIGSFDKHSSSFEINDQRNYWIHVFDGEGEVAGNKVVSGDSLALNSESNLEVKASGKLKFLIFDLA